VQTFIDTAGKNYAGIGYTYDAVNENFIAPQPYPSWTLDSNDLATTSATTTSTTVEHIGTNNYKNGYLMNLKKLISRIDKSATRQLKAV
jgi:hypothetical protein